jgi:hypothetical protein
MYHIRLGRYYNVVVLITKVIHMNMESVLAKGKIIQCTILIASSYMIVRATGSPSRVVECLTREKHLALPVRHQYPPKNARQAPNRDVWHRHLTRSTHAAQNDAAKVMPTPVVRKFYMLQ